MLSICGTYQEMQCLLCYTQLNVQKYTTKINKLRLVHQIIPSNVWLKVEFIIAMLNEDA